MPDFDPFDVQSYLPDPATGEPFLTGAIGQTHRREADMRIFVAGRDVTNRLNPYLINMHIVIMPPEWEIHLELDDRDGQLPIPPLNADVFVRIGWKNEALHDAFEGKIHDVEHGFGRKQGGRRMWVHARTSNPQSAIKTPMENSWGAGAPPGKQEGEKVPFSKVGEEVGKHARIGVKINPRLGSIARDFWAQSNESPMHFLQRMANELGGTYNVGMGGNVEISVPGENADGTPGNRIVAKWYDGNEGNLIGYRVRPVSARGTWQGGSQKWYDHAKAQWQEVTKKFDLPLPWGYNQNTYSPQGPAANESNAGQDNEAAGQATSDNMGLGRIVINGEPGVRLADIAWIIGVRPGVDGPYFIAGFEHLYSRQGFITWLDVHPRAGAGADAAYWQNQMNTAMGLARTGPTPQNPPTPPPENT